jgi:phosphoglycerate dehydrogenase-like enzyme
MDSSLYAGVEGIVRSALGQLDITITATKGIHGQPISDHVIAFIFSFLRSLPALGEFQRQKIWYRSFEHPEQPDLASEESFDKTVGIIGLGSIGQCIAQKCKALGMRVLSTKRVPVTCPWVDVCYSPDGLHHLLRESDFVVIAAPQTRETDHLIGEHQLQMMKSKAYLINISRGAIIDQSALVKALENKWIAGAALDTVESEPLAKTARFGQCPM